MAAKFRLLIGQEKKNEEINLVKKKKIQLYLSPLIYTSLFLLKSTRLFNVIFKKHVGTSINFGKVVYGSFSNE
jgi:hypothetical protein